MPAKVVLVTGASRGIGAATAIRLAEDGYDVGVGYGASDAGAREIVARIESLGRRAVGLRADIASGEEVEGMVRDAVAALGRLDVLVNNAGVYERAGLDAITRAAWDRRLAVNLSGCFYAAKAAVPHLRAAGGGRIVNVTSQVAFRGTDHGADYAAAKAGLVGLTRALAREFAKDGILVNAVAPGAIDTAILAVDSPEARVRREAAVPLRRVGRAEEVAAAIAFLVGPGGDYITGQVVHVNGGALTW